MKKNASQGNELQRSYKDGYTQISYYYDLSSFSIISWLYDTVIYNSYTTDKNYLKNYVKV